VIGDLQFFVPGPLLGSAKLLPMASSLQPVITHSLFEIELTAYVTDGRGYSCFLETHLRSDCKRRTKNQERKTGIRHSLFDIRN